MIPAPMQAVANLARAGRHADAVQAATTALAAPGPLVAEQHALLDQRPALVALALLRQASAALNLDPARAATCAEQAAERFAALGDVAHQGQALRVLAAVRLAEADTSEHHALAVEAIESVERQIYDLVLMDVQIPEMDGLEASRRITAQHPPHERARIVAMTANAMQGDREACLAAGMDDYVTKPIRVDALVQALMNAAPRGAA